MSKELVLICNEDGKWQAYESDHSVVIVCASQEEQDRACEILSKIGTDDDLRAQSAAPMGNRGGTAEWMKK